MNLVLSIPIFCIDLVQRGFAAFAKDATFTIPHISQALSIYFLVLSVGVLIAGWICDNRNARSVLLYAMIVAGVGMALIPYTAWGFGLLFGGSAALIKVAPFSAPLKIGSGQMAIKICPQAAAKNLSGALFILFLSVFLVQLGWKTTSLILGILIILSGIWINRVVPNDYVRGWNWGVLKTLVKDPQFWMMAVYFFLMCGWYYGAIAGYVPELSKSFGKQTAMTIVAVSFLVSGALRFFVAWLGDQRVRGYKIRLPLLWIGTFGMGACIPLTPHFPLTSLAIFTFMSSIHTPNYWAYCREEWGPVYISTVVSLGFFFMYLGAGVMYGIWGS